ncbi:helicase HerA domain-containing protein [Myxococcus sp. Y35]|uniref:helicase HerA domain-containing protein n=1 Tax=Pseudomyxococcus flavus TaxID=3115648 RepID=UPI003CE7B4CC
MANDPRLDIFLNDPREVFSSVEQGQHIWQADPFDVEALNAPARRAFKRLLARATSDAPPDAGKLLLLLGESGSGKTHLVRAFRNFAHGQRQGFVGYMPMTVDAAQYDRYILSNLIDSLDKPFDLAGDDDDSGLMHLSDALMAQCNSAFAPLIPDEKVLEDDELHGTIRAVADELLADPRFQQVEVDLLRALIYLQRRDPRLNRRIFHWLRCEDLSLADRRVIGDLIPRTADDAPARMVEHLGRLMGALGQALVLCVDQVEDVSDFEQRPQMEGSFRRAMNSLAAIASRVPRSIVVFCCLSDYWAKMRPLLNQSIVDRIENDPEPVMLEQTVTADTARDLAARRLHSLFEQRGASSNPADPTWPIPAQGFDVLGGHRARDVLNECRRYRDRAIQDQKLPAEFPLKRPRADGKAHTTVAHPPTLDMDQLWTDFRAAFKAELPEEDSDVAALLAWAIEAGSNELGGTPRFDVKPKDNEMLDVQVQPEGRKLLVALCDRNPRGGALGRQMTEALKKAAGKTPVLVRTSEFPSSTGTIVAEQIGVLMRKGGRRVIVGDTELRDLVALRSFREKHAAEAALIEWSRTAKPITRLKSVSDILGLERLDSPPPPSGPKSTRPVPRSDTGVGVPIGQVGARPTAAKGQTELFNGPTTLPYGTPVPVELRAGATREPAARAEATGLAPGDTLPRHESELGMSRNTAAAPVSDDPLQNLTIPSPMLTTARTVTPPGGTKPRIGFAGNQSVPPATEATPTPPAEVLTGPLRIGASEGVFTQVVTLEPSELTRHSAFLGGSGSGKTTLALNVLEQLLLRGIPAILIDRKGDLAAYARDASWEEKLEDSALLERRRLLRERVEVAVYTPGRSDGRPLAIPVIPRGLESLPTEEREQGVQQAADAIAGMLDYKATPNDKAARALLAQALRLLVQRPPGKELSLDMVQKFVADQDEALLQETRGLPARTFAKLAQDLEVLRLDIRPMLAAGGERLDVEDLLGLGASKTPGKTRLSIISTKYLGDNSRILFWVAQLLLETNRWASQHPSSELQAVLLFDEADLYLPATSKPATKQPMENLLKRARSAGIGVMLATQSPGDLDYKCRENVRTWFVGGVKEDNALKKLKPMFSEARVDAETRLPGQKQGQFHVLRDGQVQQLKADRSVIKTDQLSEDEILKEARRTLERSSTAGTPKAGGPH